uniref:Uncharacterized protein n=1 Tax=Rhizophora mucronata TaxID=61149 RepID=A0A2P2L890_RHIMU
MIIIFFLCRRRRHHLLPFCSQNLLRVKIFPTTLLTRGEMIVGRTGWVSILPTL